MKRVKTGIIGLGYWGPNLLRNFSAQPHCHLAWGCDLDEANLAKANAHYPAVTYTKNAKDLFADPELELVLIATPTGSHYPLAKEALEAGKHVFIEKPMTSTAAQAEELIALAKKKKRLLFVDHTFAFSASVRKIVSMVEALDLGSLLYFDSTRINLGIIQKDTNVLYDLAIHDLSILSAFMDLKEITSVAAIGNRHFGEQVEVAHLHLNFRSGFHAHIHVSWLSPVKIRRTILAGSRAMITYDDTEPSEKLRFYDRGVERDDTKPDPFFPKYRSGDILIPALPIVEALATEADHVLRCALGESEPLMPGEEGRNVLKVLEAADESLANGGSPVSLAS